jgi:hypothetical protein
MMQLSLFSRLGLWGGLAVLLLGGLAFVAWGRPGARESLSIAPTTGLAPTTPPLDEQVPDGLHTATFSLG